MINRTVVIPLLFGVVFLAGCASTGTTQTAALDDFLERNQLELGEPVRNVSSFQVRGFQTLDDRQIVLTAGSKRHYLVTTMGICVGLRSAFNIGFDNRTSGISRADSIVIRGIRGKPQRCPIQEIEQLNEIEADGPADAGT